MQIVANRTNRTNKVTRNCAFHKANETILCK